MPQPTEAPASTQPNPATSSSQPESGPQLGDYSEAYTAIDQMAGSTPERDREVENPSQDPKPEAKEPKKETPKPVSKEKSQPKKALGDDLDAIVGAKDEPKKEASETPKPDDTEKLFEAPGTPKQLREIHKKTREELRAATERIRELETATEKASREATEHVKSEYERRLAQSEKARAEHEEKLRFIDYKSSEEFESKYRTPLKDAWNETLTAFAGMTITDEDGKEREVSPQDFSELMTMPNVQARRAAEAKFGTAAPEVMVHRAKLMGLQTNLQKAVDEWKVRGSERENQVREHRESIRKQWEADIKGYQEEYPDLFGDRDGDSPGNDLIRSGFSLAKLALLGEGLSEGLTTQERTAKVLDAQTKLSIRAMAFPRVLRDLKSAEKEIETLRSRLAEYESSELPHGVRREDGDSGSGTRSETPEDEIDRIPAYGRR